jgi:hypothetical protein
MILTVVLNGARVIVLNHVRNRKPGLFSSVQKEQ